MDISLIANTSDKILHAESSLEERTHKRKQIVNNGQASVEGNAH